jgi:hypothetical protein
MLRPQRQGGNAEKFLLYDIASVQSGSAEDKFRTFYVVELLRIEKPLVIEYKYYMLHAFKEHHVDFSLCRSCLGQMWLVLSEVRNIVRRFGLHACPLHCVEPVGVFSRMTLTR